MEGGGIMETYFLSFANDNRSLDECNSLARAFYLAHQLAYSWQEDIAISILVDGQLEDYAIVEPSYPNPYY